MPVTAGLKLREVVDNEPGQEELPVPAVPEQEQPPLAQAQEQPAPAGLPADSFVVFGGKNMSSAKLTLRVTTEYDRGNGWVHSVLCEAGFQPLEIVARRREIAPDSFKWTWCRVSTVLTLRAGGYDVVSHGTRGHARIVFPAEPDENDWVKLRAAFNQPIQCPPAVEEN